MTAVASHTPDVDRARANTSPAINQAIDRRMQVQLRWAAGSAETEDITARLDQLNREWNVDRVIEAEAAFMGLATLALAVFVDRRLLVLPAFVASMVLLHGVQGWYPLLPLFRRLGVRTADEIDKERYALKALRGDFAGLAGERAGASARAAAAWKAVCA